MRNLFLALTKGEIETRRRIKLAIWAYAYEIENVSLVPDCVYDVECRLVDLSVATARGDLDAWFCSSFDPSTGMWIHHHPELNKIQQLYRKYHDPQHARP
jgi:hypothetical protein